MLDSSRRPLLEFKYERPCPQAPLVPLLFVDLVRGNHEQCRRQSVFAAKMKSSTANRCAFAILMVLPLLPVCGFVFNGSPQVVFFIGTTVFIIGVLLIVWLVAFGITPLAGSPPVGKRFHFTIRDLLCLTTVLFGMTMFMVSGFRCEAAEKLSRPAPLPAAVFRQFVWELEAGLVCTTIGGLVLIRSALHSAIRPSQELVRTAAIVENQE